MARFPVGRFRNNSKNDPTPNHLYSFVGSIDDDGGGDGDGDNDGDKDDDDDNNNMGGDDDDNITKTSSKSLVISTLNIRR